MADTRSLDTRIKDAERSLNGAFGIQKDQEGKDANRFLDLESLASAYKEEASSREVTQQFLSIAKSVRGMRSSYLPIDFFINGDTGTFDSDIASKVAPQESYENAFMRMLGMPSIGLAEFGLTLEDSEIRSSETIKIVDPISGNISDASFEEIKKKILDVRQQSRNSRKFLINNQIYNISDETAALLSENIIPIRSLTLEEKADLLGTVVDKSTSQLVDPSTGQVATFTPTEISRESEEEPYLNPYTGAEISASKIKELLISVEEKETQVAIESIGQDLWKFSYLLIPPIQSAEISKSINEPNKIVAPPFSNSRNRRVNDADVRPTLLESIIRIRLDKVSGTDTFVESEEADSGDFSIEFKIGNSSGSVEVVGDDYGVLEALFILRLRSALSGLAQKLYSDIDIMINEMEKSRRVPTDENPNTGQEENEFSNEASPQIKGTEDEADDDAISEIALNTLQQQKLIEDSILFLLGDRSEVLDLQSQTQRSSSIHNSHMMSGLIGIIDVPRRRIDEDVNRIIESRNNQASNIVSQKTQEIGTMLGTDIGIGTIDLAVFSLALFTLSERSLLGLLSKAQYDRLKNGEFKSLIPEADEKEDSIIAINELTQLIIDGYKIFISELENDRRID